MSTCIIFVALLAILFSCASGCTYSYECSGSEICVAGTCSYSGSTGILGMSIVIFLLLVFLLPAVVIGLCIWLCVVMSRRRRNPIILRQQQASGVTMIHQQQQPQYMPYQNQYQSPLPPPPQMPQQQPHYGQPNYGYQQFPEQGQQVNTGPPGEASAPPPYDGLTYSKSQGVPQ